MKIVKAPNLPQQKEIGFSQGLGVRLQSVSPMVGGPAMSLGNEAQTAKLAHHGGAVGFWFQGRRAWIAMAIDNIASMRIDPAAGVIDQTRRVKRLEALRQTLRVILPPAFIKKDPEDDRGMVVLILNYVLQLDFEFALPVRSGIIAAGHVLPDQKPKFVAPIIPTVRLDLDMFPCQVESGGFEKGEIGSERVIGRGGVDAIGPKALVQRADLKQGLAIQGDARDALGILEQRNFPHPEVAGHGIDFLPSLFQRNLQIIKKWRIRRPQPGFRHRQEQLRTGGTDHAA